MILKYYEDGSPFVIMFADGTGTVYYHSGRHAITISSTGQLAVCIYCDQSTWLKFFFHDNALGLFNRNYITKKGLRFENNIVNYSATILFNFESIRCGYFSYNNSSNLFSKFCSKKKKKKPLTILSSHYG